MTQTLESTATDPVNSVLGNGANTPEDLAPNSMVYVYGHGPTRNPFYEEARALSGNEKGALLILSASVNRGQKLLLISAAGNDPVEAEVVRTRTLDAQTFEVDIAFSFARPDFWKSSRRTAKEKQGLEKRRSPRVGLPRGMTIAWQGTRQHDISRVSSLSLGGLFIEVANPAPAGETLQVQFDIPGGAIRGQAVVRRSVTGEGMGVEFTDLPEASRTRLGGLLQKLLGNIRRPKS
jgi:PilZ domain